MRDTVTVQECIEMYAKGNMTVISCGGEEVKFVQEKSVADDQSNNALVAE